MPSVPLTTGEIKPSPDTTAAAVELSLPALSQPLRTALLAVSDDASRPVLNAVHVYWRGGVEPLVVEATDSYRLHHVRTVHYDRRGGPRPFEVLIPGRWLRVTVAALAGDHRSKLRFEGGNVSAHGYGESRSTSLANGTFPLTEQFLAPREHDPGQTIAITARYLQDMFRAAAVWGDTPVRFSIPTGGLQPVHVTIKPPDAVVTLVLMPVRVP